MASQNAVVARATDHGLAFLVAGQGRIDWTTDDRIVQTFADVREATRTAMRLPGRFRAFALPGRPSNWCEGRALT
jgi:hypothetical protein